MSKKIYVVTILLEHESYETDAYSDVKLNWEEVKNYVKEELNYYNTECNWGITEANLTKADEQLQTEKNVTTICLKNPTSLITFSIISYRIPMD